MVNVPLLIVAALVLSIERVVYVWIWRKPHEFQAWCRRLFPANGDPVSIVSALFGVFKIVQVGVFAAWCYVHASGALRRESTSGWVTALGGVAVALGQLLNGAVFARLGKTGVFYGNRFGYRVERCERFPFTLCRHPQYVGTVLSIWGALFIMRFPAPDWSVLPVLETLYYAIGASLEQSPADVVETS